MKSCGKGDVLWAGGAQMFKDSEKGNKEINISELRALETDSKIIACMSIL